LKAPNRIFFISCLSLFLSVCMSVPSISQASDLRFRLGSDGDILAWLTAGPFPNEGALQLRGTGFRTDYLSGEAGINPREGDAAGSFHWRLATGSVKHGIDLKGLFRSNDPGIGYCYANLESPKEQKAKLLFGSDDGAKVYLNGVQLFSKQIARGIKRDEDSVPIHLVKGRNRLLFKIEQGDGDWGLMARIVGAIGLIEVLPIASDTHDDLVFARRLADTKGTFDVEAWSNFTAIHRQSVRFLTHLRDRAKDPSKLDAILAEATSRLDKPDTDLNVLSSDMEKLGKKLKSQFDAAREPLIKWAQSPGPLFEVDPVHQDSIKVLSGGRYFAHADGKPFIPIGANHNPDWPELVQSDPLRDDYNPERTDRWFANLAAHGVNVIRLMVETPPSGNLEDPVGTIRPEHLIWLDHIVTSARRHGVRLWVTPYDTFWMNLRKETSPYWSANGGPIEKPIDFLTVRKIIDLEKRRIQFLIDRYGNSDTIFAWEIMNEIDLWWGGSPEQIKVWVDEVASDIRKYEKAKWGRSHLLTVSFAEAMPKGLNADTAFRRQDLDFATMHLYIGTSRGPKPGQAEQTGADFASGVIYARHQVRDSRPVLDGESGPIDHWISDGSFDDAVFHDMSWAHLLAGGAGPGTRWPYRQPHHVSAGMLTTLKAMSLFCADVPWMSLTGSAQIQVADLNTSNRMSSLSTDRGAILWLRTSSGSTARSFSFDPPKHAMRYRVFNIKNSQWVTSEVRLHSGSKVTIDLPLGIDEAAVWLGP